MKLRSALTGLLLLLPGIAHGQISNIADQVGSGLISGFGGFVGMAEFLRYRLLLLLAPIGIFIVVRAGLRLINSQDEGKLEAAKRTIAATCVGIMLAWVSDRLVMAFYAPGGTWSEGTVITGASILTLEIAGILNWVTTLVAALAILIIVASGIRAVGSFGKEENAAEVKRTVAGVVTGIGMIILSGAIKLTLGLNPDVVPSLPGMPSPDPIITRSIGITITVLSFLALVAFVVVVYAGLLMVFNMGNEEQFNKGKAIIIRVLIGLTVVLFSGVLAIFVLNLFL